MGPLLGQEEEEEANVHDQGADLVTVEGTREVLEEEQTLLPLPEVSLRPEVRPEGRLEASPSLLLPNEGVPPSSEQTPRLLPQSQVLFDPTGPVGGRLSSYWQEWERMGASQWVVSVLRWGYSLEF